MARKASLSLMLGWFVVAIAGLAVAGFGFGIAQAGGNHSESPVLSFKDMEALEQGSSSSPSARVLPSTVDLDYTADGTPSPDVAHVRGAVDAGSLPGDSIQEFVPEDNWSGTDWQTRGPVETVAIPVMVSGESWMKDYGND